MTMTAELNLPPVPHLPSASRSEPADPTPRVREPERRQSEMRFEAPEDLLPPAHPARVLWDVVGTLDLSPFLAQTKSVEGAAGRDVLSPRMLLTLWLFAIIKGISSAR